MTTSAAPDRAELFSEGIAALSVEDTLSLYDEVDSFIATIQAQLAPALQERAALLKVIEQKLRADGATKLVTDEFELAIEPGKKTTAKRDDVLRELLEVPGIPEVERRKAIWLEEREPLLKTHATYLKKLSAYGKRVQDILARGIVEEVGPERLTIRRVEKIAQPTAIEGTA